RRLRPLRARRWEREAARRNAVRLRARARARGFPSPPSAGARARGGGPRRAGGSPSRGLAPAADAVEEEMQLPRPGAVDLFQSRVQALDFGVGVGHGAVVLLVLREELGQSVVNELVLG